jgi:hypothetical protein
MEEVLNAIVYILVSSTVLGGVLVCYAAITGRRR